MMELTEGRPATCAGRLSKEIKVYDFLDELKISYQRVDHEAANTMEACQAIDAILDADICKNLFLCNRQHTQFYLLMILKDKKFKTKDISGQINSSRLSFAEPEYLEEYLDLTPGSVTVLGLLNDPEQKVRLLMDEDLLQGTYFGCHPCINTSSLRLRTADLFEKILPALNHKATFVHLEAESDA